MTEEFLILGVFILGYTSGAIFGIWLHSDPEIGVPKYEDVLPPPPAKPKKPEFPNDRCTIHQEG